VHYFWLIPVGVLQDVSGVKEENMPKIFCGVKTIEDQYSEEAKNPGGTWVKMVRKDNGDAVINPKTGRGSFFYRSEQTSFHRPPPDTLCSES